jgi:hypothetical protein
MSVVNTIAMKKWAATVANIKKKAYIIIAILVTVGISYFFYSILNKPVAGVLLFLGSALIFFYYWIKWFAIPQPPDPDFNPGKNACPDYLSVVPSNSGLYKPSSPTQYFCVDYVGVSRNGALKKMDPKKLPTNIKNPAYTFSVDPSVDFRNAATRAAFVQRIMKAGLSYNSLGDNSLPIQGPFTD